MTSQYSMESGKHAFVFPVLLRVSLDCDWHFNVAARTQVLVAGKLLQILKQRFRSNEVRRSETLREPVESRGKQRARVAAFVLRLPEPGETHDDALRRWAPANWIAS